MIQRWPRTHDAQARADLDAAPARGDWQIRYRLPGDGEPIIEKMATKQQARDRYFTVKEFSGLEFCELRGPGGKLWFRDHFFSKGSPP